MAHLSFTVIAIVLATHLLMQRLKLLVLLLCLSKHLGVQLMLLLPDCNLLTKPVFQLLLWTLLALMMAVTVTLVAAVEVVADAH